MADMTLDNEIQMYLATRAARQQRLVQAVMNLSAAMVEVAEAEALGQGHDDLQTRLKYQDVFAQSFAHAHRQALIALGQIDPNE